MKNTIYELESNICHDFNIMKNSYNKCKKLAVETVTFNNVKTENRLHTSIDMFKMKYCMKQEKCAASNTKNLILLTGTIYAEKIQIQEKANTQRFKP